MEKRTDVHRVERRLAVSPETQNIFAEMRKRAGQIILNARLRQREIVTVKRSRRLLREHERRIEQGRIRRRDLCRVTRAEKRLAQNRTLLSFLAEGEKRGARRLHSLLCGKRADVDRPYRPARQPFYLKDDLGRGEGLEGGILFMKQ